MTPLSVPSSSAIGFSVLALLLVFLFTRLLTSSRLIPSRDAQISALLESAGSAEMDSEQQELYFPLHDLLDDILPRVHKYLSSERGLIQTSSRLRQAGLGDVSLALNRKYTRRYIDDVDGFRGQVDSKRSSPRKLLRLNLGQDFSRYMTGSEYRDRVDALVENPRTCLVSEVGQSLIKYFQTRHAKEKRR